MAQTRRLGVGAWVVSGCMVASNWLKQLDFNRRLQQSCWRCVVNLLKSLSTTSCPWALADFNWRLVTAH
jgi:hypothetical protein